MRKETNEDFNSDIDEKIFTECGASCRSDYHHPGTHADGIVKDNKTGEPLIGTVIRVKELPNVSTTTGLDGTFTLHELPDKGKVTIIVSYMSYKTREMVVDVAKDFSKDGKEGKDGQLTIAMEEDLKQLGEVVVTGHREYRSDRSAIESVKNAGNVLNVMSQQSIQLSPDVNVASVLQRVSGVTMERDASGEASYAILRGMDKRYNYTLVNGVKIPSPDDKNRYIPLNIFPSDLMDRLVVSKSLTADMEGDAAGGVVDMVMKDAPSVSRFRRMQPSEQVIISGRMAEIILPATALIIQRNLLTRLSEKTIRHR